MRGFSIGFLALCAGLGLSSGARASFELVMVADTGTKSIHRFDGTTGVYLGSFGGGFLVSPASFTIDSVNGIAYVGDSTLGRVRGFNYNTGVLVSDFTLGSAGASQALSRAADGSFYSGGIDGGFTRLSAVGVFLPAVLNQNVAGGSAVGMGSVAHRSGRQFLATYKSDLTANAALQISTGVGLTSFKSSELTSMGSWNTRAQLAMQGDRGIWMCTNRTMQNFTTNAAGSTIAFGTSYALTDFFNNSANGVGFGHGDTVYVAGRNSGNTSGVIGRYVYGNSTQISSFGSGIIQTPGMVQVVVAPEPGSMIALGLGLAGVLGRRRAMRKSA
jgi:hypothetical protein